MNKMIINVGRGGYAYTMPMSEYNLGTNDLESSAALIATGQNSKKTALFNVDQLVDDKVLLNTIQEVFPGNEPLYFRIPARHERLYLVENTVAETLLSKERIAINQINQITIAKTLNHHKLISRNNSVDRSLAQNRIKHLGFIFDTSTQHYYDYPSKNYNDNTVTNATNFDENGCKRYFAQCYRQFGGFPHPPMIDFCRYKITLTQKNVDCMLKGYWLLEKMHHRHANIVHDADTELRLFFIQTYDIAKNCSIKTIALADQQNRLWHEHREKLHDFLILHFLNSPFGYKLLYTQTEKLECLITTLAKIIAAAIYQESHWFEKLKSRLVGQHKNTHLLLDTTLSSNITKILCNELET